MNPRNSVLADVTVPYFEPPEGLELHEEVGKGANNKVFRVTLEGREMALRVPRRRSDTQQRNAAAWELRTALRAAELDVGPRIERAWRARHANDRWPSGLYLLTELFTHDLEKILYDPGLREEREEELADELVRCLETLARAKIFVFDLKPSNVLVDDSFRVRVIDYGNDFCEWGEVDDDPCCHTPILSMLQKRIANRPWKAKEDANAVLEHVLFASMMVLLSSTIAWRLYDDRHEHRLDAEERQDAHLLADRVDDLLSSMRGCDVALVREVLRDDEVRGVLGHYHGRRNAGTRRTFRFAREGVERHDTDRRDSSATK